MSRRLIPLYGSQLGKVKAMLGAEGLKGDLFCSQYLSPVLDLTHFVSEPLFDVAYGVSGVESVSEAGWQSFAHAGDQEVRVPDDEIWRVQMMWASLASEDFTFTKFGSHNANDPTSVVPFTLFGACKEWCFVFPSDYFLYPGEFVNVYVNAITSAGILVFSVFGEKWKVK